MRTSAGKVIGTIIYLVILLGLIYAFHLELFVASVRLYTLAVKCPRCERLLGDYYQYVSQNSAELASGFYVSGLKSLKDKLNETTNPDVQAKIKLNIGRYYECGKGVNKDNSEASRWYSDALTTLDTVKQPTQKEAVLRTEITQHLRSIKSPGDGKSSPCNFSNPELFIRETFWTYDAP